MRGQLAGRSGVVGHRLEALVLGPEGDGVGLDRRVRLARQRGDEARVEPAAEEGGHRARRPPGGPRPTPRPPPRGRPAGRQRRPARPRPGPSTVRLGACRRFGTRPRTRAGAWHALDGASLVRQPVVERRGDQRSGSTVSSGPTAATIALSSEANRTPRPRGMTYSGLMPSGSRARASAPVRSSWIANANMPRNRERPSGPQRRQPRAPPRCRTP